MLNNLTGKQRIWVVVAIAWILFVLFKSAPWAHPFYGHIESGKWNEFFIIGIGPVACVLAILWVRRGYRLEREVKPKAAADVKDTVMCPGCQHQMRRNTPEQTKFCCTRCNTAFYRCRSCGEVTPEPQAQVK